MVVKHPCLSCKRAVAKHHHALACDFCKQWAQLACGTGYAKKEYKTAVECKYCIHFAFISFHVTILMLFFQLFIIQPFVVVRHELPFFYINMTLLTTQLKPL